MSTADAGPVRITNHPPGTFIRKTPITPEITASFTMAEYKGNLVFDDYTKFLATVALFASNNTDRPVASMDTATANHWTTTEVVHFSFPRAFVKKAGQYYVQVTVYYPTEIDYENVGVAYSAAFTVI